MTRGPIPNPVRRRGNAPTIRTTFLPAESRSVTVPEVPKAYRLGESGRAWWDWAWGLPQATKWGDGALYVVARRAVLEDLVASLDFAEQADLSELLAGAAPEATRQLERVLATLKRAAASHVALCREMRELDKRLGLDPKALLELRWVIGPGDDTTPAPAASRQPNVRTLRAVEPTGGVE